MRAETNRRHWPIGRIFNSGRRNLLALDLFVCAWVLWGMLPQVVIPEDPNHYWQESLLWVARWCYLWFGLGCTLSMFSLREYLSVERCVPRDAPR